MTKEDGNSPKAKDVSRNGETRLMLGYSDQDNKKALGIITKLLPHLAQDGVVIVGGLARRHHLLRHGLAVPARPFNDLDVMIRDSGEMNPSITNDFIIAHYHPPGERGFYAGLIDPQTKIKVDVFDYRHTPVDPETVEVADIHLRVRGIEDQLTHHVYEILKFLSGKSVSPKQFDAISQLMQIADLEKARQIWERKYADKFPFSLEDAIQQVEIERERHPERVFEHPGRKFEAYSCPECVQVLNYPIAPMEEVIKVLGYVE